MEPMESDAWFPNCKQATWSPDHHEDHANAEGQHSIKFKIPEYFRQADHQKGCNHNAQLAAHAAQHDNGKNDGGFNKGKTLWRDEALLGGEEGAGKATKGGGDHEGH